ncbi:glycosyltransferase family 2 protein [Dyadobacter psychrotolerans]|uniref:Glycosyltransferase n=1 Tax=Dyadobacter psychrotolerans TaxID=2541721 RepID=A0A4R5DV20_9BACT|nr:glycosyltransferase family 2 protein [Dyadobacter psychrotolerans]TDE14843.1 glycosyltransferase [Dyadobacter psychrotolerans]
MKLTIITVNLNNRDGLKKTITSVLGQSFQDFEYIIVDGGSTDGSVEVIKEQQTGCCRWVSEADKGIYHAMNKGIKMANSEYLLFLNSGDFLLDQHTLSQAAGQLDGVEIVYGNLRVGHKDTYRDSLYPAKLTFSYFISKSLPHPSTFIKSTLFQRAGIYDQNMKICADWAFFVRSIGLFKASYKHICQTVSVFNTDGISSSPSSRQLMQQEKMNLLKDDFSFFETDYESYLDMKENIDALRRSKPYKILKFLGLPKYQA